MKVTTWIDLNQEVEVEVSIAEVMSSIAGLVESDQIPMTLDCIASVHRVLLNIPDHRIAAMNPKQRELIAQGLRAQADRYNPTAKES